MRPRMIFKFGVTVVIAVAVIIVYVRHTDPDHDLQNQTEAEDRNIKDKETGRKSNIAKENQNKNAKILEKNNLKEDSKGNTKMFDSSQKDKVKSAEPKELDSKTQNDNVIEFVQQAQNEKNKPKVEEKEREKEGKSIKDESKEDKVFEAVYFSSESAPANSIHLSVVACGDRMGESLVLLKSAVLFTKKHLIFHIFAEDELQKKFRDKIEFWPKKFLSRVDYFIYNITFPTGENSDQWRKLFKPCASQRLFIPVLLTKVDSLIYVDTDILFLRPLEDLWSFFDRFNSTQLAGVAPEHEDAAAGWYNRFARHPYYGKLGLNSGVFLMNLTRMRSSPWLSAMMEYYKEYKLKIAWGDQDLLNIYFHYYPDQVYVYGCEWNYRPDHCMYMSVCKQAEVDGASVLHGCRRVWHTEKQPTFRAIYEAFRDHRLGDDVQYKLLVQIERNMKSGEMTRCGKVGHIFTKQIELFSQRKRAEEKKAKMKNKTDDSPDLDRNGKIAPDKKIKTAKQNQHEEKVFPQASKNKQEKIAIPSSRR